MPDLTDRKDKRKELELSALIYTGPGRKLLDCLVLDMSKGGAKLEVSFHLDVPDIFVLLLSADGQVRRFCKRVWRHGNEVGARFFEPNTASADANSL